ncbi:hypothetical protein FQN54_002541 [Arachnomyces sp. PD_36]|nr:hypothetical protein FQN54_002541 [Arachnomyces sp. PD_36]
MMLRDDDNSSISTVSEFDGTLLAPSKVFVNPPKVGEKVQIEDDGFWYDSRVTVVDGDEIDYIYWDGLPEPTSVTEARDDGNGDEKDSGSLFISEEQLIQLGKGTRRLWRLWRENIRSATFGLTAASISATLSRHPLCTWISDATTILPTTCNSTFLLELLTSKVTDRYVIEFSPALSAWIGYVLSLRGHNRFWVLSQRSRLGGVHFRALPLDQPIDFLMIFDCCYGFLPTRDTKPSNHLVKLISSGDVRDPIAFGAGVTNILTSKILVEVRARAQQGYKRVEIADIVISIQQNSPLKKPSHAAQVGTDFVTFAVNAAAAATVNTPSSNLSPAPGMLATFSMHGRASFTHEELNGLVKWIDDSRHSAPH